MGSNDADSAVGPPPPRITSQITYGPEPLVKNLSTDMSAADKPFGGLQMSGRDEIVRVLHPLLIAAGSEILQAPFM